MITKQVVIDKIEVLEDGVIQVRQATRIVEDGVVIGQTYHRKSFTPGAVLAGEDAKVAAVATAMWTPGVVAAYAAARAKP